MFNKKRLVVFVSFLFMLFLMMAYASTREQNQTIATRDVTFIDGFNNEAISEQKVEVGHDAEVPENPYHENYLFAGWYDKSDDTTRVTNFKNILKNLTVIAKYADDKNNNKVADNAETLIVVMFMDTFNDTVLKTEEVLPGMSATAPLVPNHENATFVGWSRGLTNLTENTTVNTVYRYTNQVVEPTPAMYDVTFIDSTNNTTIAVVNTQEGLTANPPVAPKYANKVFDHWQGDFSNIQGNITITAIYADDYNNNEINDKTEPHYTVEFLAGGMGTLGGASKYEDVLVGLTFAQAGIHVPEVTALEGYSHTGWSPSINTTVSGKAAYTAIYLDILAPVLEEVKIAGEENKIYLNEGKTVILTFKASEELQEAPVVVMGGKTFNELNADYTYDAETKTYKIETKVTSDMPEGQLAFSIDYNDLTGNNGVTVTATTDESKVIIDKIIPDFKLYVGEVGDLEDHAVVKHEQVAVWANDLSPIKVYLNDTLIFTGDLQADTKYLIHQVSNLVNGLNVFKVVDEAGNEKTISITTTIAAPELKVSENNVPLTLNQLVNFKQVVVFAKDYSPVKVYLNDTLVFSKDTRQEWYDEKVYIIHNVMNTVEGENTIVAVDVFNNKSTFTFYVDTKEPTATVKYTPSKITRGPVVVTLTASEEIEDIAGWTTTDHITFTKSYADNVSETVTIKDLAGNTNTVDVNVENIDKVNPVIKINGASPVSLYGSNATVTVEDENPDKLVVYMLVNLLGKEIKVKATNPATIDGNYLAEATDKAGNTSTVRFSIDKTDPIILGNKIPLVTNGILFNKNVVITMIDTNKDQIMVDGSVYDGSEITGEGIHTVIATDLAGNSVTRTFVIDKTAPIIKINGDLPSAMYNTDAVVTAEDDNLLSLIITKKGSLMPVSTTVEKDGIYKAVAVDKAGNIATIEFTVDKTYPALSLNSNDLGYTNKNSIDVMGSVNDLYLKEYKYQILDSNKANTLGENGWSRLGGTSNVDDGLLFTADVTSLVDGTYWIRVWAVDQAGNQTGTITDPYIAKFVIDRTKPLVTVNINGDRNNLVTTNAVVSKNLTPELKVTDLNLDGFKIFDETNKVVANVSGLTVTYRYSKFDHLKEGTYRIVGYDKAGNESDAFVVTMDNTFPTLSLNSNDLGYISGNSVDVMGSVNDLNLSEYKYQILDSNKANTLGENGWSRLGGTSNVDDGLLFTASLATLMDGTYWMRAWARDKAGNQTGTIEDPYITKFIVDKTKPLVTVSVDGDRSNLIASNAVVSKAQKPELKVADINLDGFKIFDEANKVVATVTGLTVTSRYSKFDHLKEGTYRIIGYDKAGNESDAFIVTLN